MRISKIGVLYFGVSFQFSKIGVFSSCFLGYFICALFYVVFEIVLKYRFFSSKVAKVCVFFICFFAVFSLFFVNSSFILYFFVGCFFFWGIYSYFFFNKKNTLLTTIESDIADIFVTAVYIVVYYPRKPMFTLYRP